MTRNQAVVTQPLLAVKEKQHRQECLCHYAREPRWDLKSAMVAPRGTRAVPPACAQRFRSAVAAATAFLVLTFAQIFYEPNADSGSCCDRTPKAGGARNERRGGSRTAPTTCYLRPRRPTL
jgi:hypothetical protein